MGTHVIADETTTPTVPATLPAMTPGRAAAWLAMSAAWADEVPDIADRDDLLVTVAPGAGHGAPACFLPPHATIEIDGEHLGEVDPATVTAHVLADRTRYATAWGLLTHECAHAQHSAWENPAGAPPGALRAATLLEESRVEGAQIARRPDDRHWLRASATNLVLADTRADDPVKAPGMSRWEAATAAALLLARVDAGILTVPEVAPVARTVETVLGADTVNELRVIWREALRAADDDAEGMVELGRRWCAAIGVDPDTDPAPGNATAPGPAPTPGSGPSPVPAAGPGAGTAPPDPATGAAPPDETGAPGEPEPDGAAPDESAVDGSGARSPLAESITEVAAAVAAAVAATPPPAAPPRRVVAAADAGEQVAQERAANAAAHVFGPRSGGLGGVSTGGTRPPQAGERTAARALGRALDTAGVRDRVTTRTTSPIPPGRLRMRGALARDAQRAAGATPTAEPFVRTVRKTVPAPPLRLGIACDVSGSMENYADAVASAAWILAHAVDHARLPGSETATVTFGHAVRAITRPGVIPAQVTTFDCDSMYHDFPGAVDALDGALDLSRPGAARLLVVVTDGIYEPTSVTDGDARVARLRASGCGVLQLSPPDPDRRIIPGATEHLLTNPATTATAIGRAATAAIRATR